MEPGTSLADLRRMADMHAVYRMFDAAGRLLYIGMTGDAGGRFGQHDGKRWFPQVETIKLEWFPAQAAARVAERRAIRVEHPRYNLADKGRPPRRRPAVPTALRHPAAQVTLAEAAAAEIVKGTLAALRMNRFRDPAFPAPVAKRGLAHVYDPVALADWQGSREAVR